MVTEEDYLKAKKIVQEYESKHLNISDVILRFSIGQYVDYKGSEYWVAEDNGGEKVLITNCEDVEDPDYNDWWVNRCDLNAL
jgi:hypothetical protein